MKKKVSEKEFLEVIDRISKRLAKRFKFGYHEIEDMNQQIVILAMEGLENYDSKRPLENFLWTHVHNRLYNEKRNKYQRPKPCLTCPLFINKECSKYTNKEDCDLYRNWRKRNDAKKNLMYFTDVEETKTENGLYIQKDDKSSDHIDIDRICFAQLNGEMRLLYLKVKSGTKISKSDNEKLAHKIRQLIENQHE